MAAVATLGTFFIIAALWPRDSAWVFVAAGFVAFVVLTRQSLVLLDVDQLVFEPPAASARTTSIPEQFPTEPDKYRLRPRGSTSPA
jgi:hypothetical protein